jgi:hypothetical protein
MRLTRRRWRWYEFAPEALLAIGLTLFAVTEPRAALSGLKSQKAITLIILVTAAWLVTRVLLARLVPWRAAGIVVFTIAAIGMLRVVVFPAYDSRTVVEMFPVQTAAAAEPTPAASPQASPAAAPQQVAVRTSTFTGIDHRASGTVTTYRTVDGRYVVGLENIDIQPGPQYVVYVVPGTGRRDKDGGTRLDDLRGNKGTQYYEVPSDLDLGSGDWTVLIWCEVFDVPIANA